jgi:hypothetical protein
MQGDVRYQHNTSIAVVVVINETAIKADVDTTIFLSMVVFRCHHQ